jgi:hypothetical protein
MTLLADLDRRRRARWLRGMAYYRQPHEPFNGNPVVELLAEIEDGINYVEEGARQGLLTAWGASELDAKLRECVAILEADQKRRLYETAEA